MVDMEHLESRPLSGLYIERGYVCPACGKWKPCHISTRQLDESLRRLSAMRPDHPSFWYHFVKAVKRAQDIQERGRLHGSIRHKDLALSR